MFSKPIFKQSLKANWVLWLIFTGAFSLIIAVVTTVFTPDLLSGMMDIMKDTPMAAMMGDRINNMTSVLGMLSQFYSMLGVILPMIFIIITANSLVAAQVDRGSMAYLLSTPTKRGTVVRTQALFLVLAIIAMFAVESVVGLTAVQLAHKGIWQDKYTADVAAAAEVLNVDKDTLSDDLTLILQNENALKAGAEARKIDVDVYAAYLTLKTADSSAQPPNASEIQQKVTLGVAAAATVLDIEPADLLGDMSKIKGSKEAISAAAEASGLPEEMFASFINAQLANKEISADKGIDFSVKKFLTLNLGLMLLQLTFSSISFLFSCVFNLSKNSFALGAGIPIASFIFQILQQTSSDLRMFKYLTFNTLYDSTKMLSGEGFAVQFAALAAVAVVLYCVGMRVFSKKDLPL
ncbi:MAG: hypothetical protein LBS90_00665 [Oscillospiraceae bacterium]|jgi:ABC-2 type transport system permease protein|nr:hypothetical protein [Oscillospiraceae bacterium]